MDQDKLSVRKKVQVLFGLGDQMQWARYTREEHPDIFAAWDRGEDNVFSGCENTQLWTEKAAQDYVRYAAKVVLGTPPQKRFCACSECVISPETSGH